RCGHRRRHTGRRRNRLQPPPPPPPRSRARQPPVRAPPRESARRGIHGSSLRAARRCATATLPASRAFRDATACIMGKKKAPTEVGAKIQRGNGGSWSTTIE